MVISLEQLQPYESNLVLSAENMRLMIKDVGADNFNCCVDIGAMAVAGDTLEDFYEKLPGEKINHIHFCDLNHEILGDRGLPLESYLRTLEEKDYAGYLSLEVFDSMYLNCAHEAFMKSMDWLRKVLRRNKVSLSLLAPPPVKLFAGGGAMPAVVWFAAITAKRIPA